MMRRKIPKISHPRIKVLGRGGFIKFFEVDYSVSSRVSSGIEFVDRLLGGGFEVDAITTVYGPAGSGKTNFALLAAIETVKRDKKVIYVDTEGGFSVERLAQLVPSSVDSKKVLDSILFLRPVSFDEQKEVILKLKELVTERVGLIVVDTITMLYRMQRSYGDDDKGVQDLNSQLLALNEIARVKNIPVLLVSQVYSGFESKKVKIVGGDVMLYTSKCLLELETLLHGKRRLVLHKHRSVGSGRDVLFRIVQGGVEELKGESYGSSVYSNG